MEDDKMTHDQYESILRLRGKIKYANYGCEDHDKKTCK